MVLAPGAAPAAGGDSFLAYPLISLVNSPVSFRFLQRTWITNGKLCSSAESFGAKTPTARQTAESSALAICTAVAFGLSRFNRAQSKRFLYSPSMI